MIFYRYEDFITEASVHITERKFLLVKETPCGYWIESDFPFRFSELSKKRWVSKTAKKRFAYPTKEEAMNNFLKRKFRQIVILKSRYKDALIAEKLGRKLLKNLQEDGKIDWSKMYAYRYDLSNSFNNNERVDKLVGELSI